MGKVGFSKGTIRYIDRIFAHDADAFPELTEVIYDGNPVRAYETRSESLDALLRAAVDKHPNREFVVYPEVDSRFTYRQFDRRVATISANLREEGVSSGDRVGLLVGNRPEFLEVFFACARLGAVVAPVNTRLSARKSEQVLTDVDPNVVIIEAKHLSKIQTADIQVTEDNFFINGASENTEFRSFDELQNEEFLDDEPAFDPPSETDTVCLFYTSGTTGHPKGCPVDNFHLTNAAENYRVSFDLDDGTGTLVPTPLFHVSGLVGGVIAVLSVAGKAVIIDSFSPKQFLETTERERLNYILGVPTNYILTMEREVPSEYDLSSLDICAYGSAPMPANMIREVRDAFPDTALCNTYGKTESVGGLASMCPDVHTDAHADTVGLPTPCMEFKIVDDDGGALPPGEIGELAFRGPIVVNEYRNRPEKTAAEFSDGWHLTGDLARFDEDGFVQLKGRHRDLIIRGGENVHPIEIQEVLAANEDVLDSSVTGFPDEVLGQRILAAVVPKPEVRLTEEQLQEHCRSELADYKQPDIFRIVDSLPRNANGKVIKDELLPDPLHHGIRAGK